MATAQRVLALYQEKYFDFNLRHFQATAGSSRRCKEPDWWPAESSEDRFAGADHL
jgi:hypothetical protein